MLNPFQEKRNDTIEKKRLLLDGVYAMLRLALFLVFALCGSQTLFGYPPQYSVLATVELTFIGLALVGTVKLAVALLMCKTNCIFVAASLMTMIAMTSVLINIIIGGPAILGLLVLTCAIALAYLSKRDKSTWTNSSPLGA